MHHTTQQAPIPYCDSCTKSLLCFRLFVYSAIYVLLAFAQLFETPRRALTSTQVILQQLFLLVLAFAFILQLRQSRSLRPIVTGQLFPNDSSHSPW